jgi:hypothetical protein
VAIDFPDLFQRLHHFALIDGFVAFGFPAKVVWNLNLVLEHPDCMFPMIASGQCKFVQDLLLFELARFQISGFHNFY